MSKHHTERNKRRQRERDYIGDELRKSDYRKTSSRIYENGKMDIDIIHPEPVYRFQGVLTEQHWCISDIPAVWPEMDELEGEVKKLESEQSTGRKARMQRKRVDALASHIDFQSMFIPEVRDSPFSDSQ